MNKTGPIIIIEDDLDDQEILEGIFQKLKYKNKIVFFSDGEKALAYLNQATDLPFLILSDINMPRLNGMELRKKIHTDAELQIKCVPYLFFTTSANKNSVVDAYSMSAQGFFIKDNSESELEITIKIMVEYWQRCYSPSQYQSEEHNE
ncbi:MAG: response regulator [Chitinophagaceae bacterium]